jgi:hypothetical protein
MNNSLRSLDIVLESYESLGARLLFLCKEQYGNDVNIRVIVAFSDQDTGRGSAVLWLIKHFGVMPVEMAEPDGRLDLQEFTESTPFSGLTLIIQSVPLIDCDTKVKNSIPPSPENNIVDLNTITNLKAHIPYLNGLPASLVKATTDKLLQQIEILNQFLANNSKNSLVGPVIYLTGLSLPEEWAESESFPSSRFIPWFCLLSRKNKMNRIYRQPELSKLLQKFPDNNPDIVNLESILFDMEAGYYIDDK